jgi:ferredoxin
MVTYFHLEFPRKIVTRPVVSDGIAKTGVSVNILRARIDETHGEIIAHVQGEGSKTEEFAEFLREEGVIVEELKNSVSVQVDGCTHCGACISVCPVEAISMNESHEVIFDSEKCISCLVCVPICPVRAIRPPPI